MDDHLAPISEVSLVNEQLLPVKQLSGYQKHHRVPDTVSDSELKHLVSLSQSDLDADLDETFTALRSAFQLKRKEISVSGPEDGAGMISTPFFNYVIEIAQWPDNPSKVVFRRSVSAIQQPEQIFSLPFDDTFGDKFSILEILTTEDLDLEAIVDHLEEAEPDFVKVDYDKDVTWCEIRVLDSQINVKIHPDNIRVTSSKQVSPRELLTAFLDIQKRFISTLDCADNRFLVNTA